MAEHIEDVLVDLIGRMEKAEVTLIQLAHEHGGRSLEGARLESKANGVALALSYAREALKHVQGAS